MVPSLASKRNLQTPLKIDDLRSKPRMASTYLMNATGNNETDALQCPSSNQNIRIPGLQTPLQPHSILGPTALLGGTAAVYSAVLRSPSSVLTPLSVIYMLLLALQKGIQPKLSKKYIDKRANTETVAMVEEIIKTAMGAFIFLLRPKEVIQKSLQEWTLSSSLIVAGIPAALYAVQGVLTYNSIPYLDGVAFNGLTQTKTLSAAICCFLILGKRQSPLQIISLLVLFLSALIFEGTIQLKANVSNHNRTQENMDKIEPKTKNIIQGKDPNLNVPSTHPQTITNKLTKEDEAMKIQQQQQQILNAQLLQKRRDWFHLGVIPCLGASFISGLAGSLSQKGLQVTGGTGRDPFLYTVEVSFFSALCLMLSILSRNIFGKQPSKEAGVSVEGKRRYFAYWKWQTLLPIILRAYGGVVTALVHKHAGSVVKGFSLMLGLVLAGLVQAIIEGDALSLNQVTGTLMVMFSGWMHFTNPPKR